MNRGAVLLNRKRELEGAGFRDLAQKLDCSTGTAHRLCRGDGLPSLPVALAAYRHAGIPVSAWLDPV